MAIIGATDVGTTRQDLVSAVVQQALIAKSKLVGTVANYSAFVPPGSKSVYIPRRGNFTAETKAEDTDLTSQALTFTQDQLSLSHKAVLSEVELIAELQSAVAVEAEVIKGSADELAKQMDDLIIAQLALASTSAPDHLLDYSNSPTDTLQVGDIANARMLLTKQFAPIDNRFMVISPAQEKAILSLSSFIDASQYGVNMPIMNGEVGKVLGFRVIVHESLADADSYFYHRDAIAFAMQLAPELKSQDNLPGVKKQYLMHTVAGAKVLQAGKWQVYYNGSGV